MNHRNGHQAAANSAPLLESFDTLFPELVDALTQNGLDDPLIRRAFDWYKEVLEYNVPFGKKNRGLSVVSSYQHLVHDPSEKDLKIANILGWCVELFQAYFLVTDDIMDKSLSRRGQPCWYKKELYISTVEKVCTKQTLLYGCHGTVLETGFQTVIGQCLDLTTAPPEAEVDFTHFTVEQHAAIVKWKTAYYSFYLPVALAMYMAGISDEESHCKAKTILLEMGHFFQVQDDYLDCYGTPEIIGKIGTDIQDNKCGWLIVTALEKASEEQKIILQENYGRWDKDCVQAVKDVYRDLDLHGVYKQYEESSYQKLMTQISTLSGKLPQAVFTDFANKIYKRNK